MSNPGVVYLARHELDNGVDFRVEDNIGEAIHIHYGDELRVDITIDKLLSLDSKADEWIEELLKDKGFQIENYDVMFLDMISSYLVDLVEVRHDRILLSDLLVYTKNWMGLPVVRSIKQSRVVKYLNNMPKELLDCDQENLPGQSNEERLASVETKIADGYPYDNKYIVLFNNQNIIRDGQHRAGCLYSKYGDMEVEVIRMFFKNSKHNVSNYPWLNTIFAWDIKRIKKWVKRFLKCWTSVGKELITHEYKL